MSDRETFFPNDIPILVFEARRPSVDRFDDPDGIPAEPIDVETKFYNGTTGLMVEVDGSETIPLGPEGSLLYMAAMDESQDRGALIYVKVPQEVTSAPGNYTLFITTTYDDDLRITQDQRIRISEYR